MNDGGSAFPFYVPPTGNWKSEGPGDLSKGLSLRDYFAAQAMFAAGCAAAMDDQIGMDYPKLAHECFRLADAMLAERSKP